MKTITEAQRKAIKTRIGNHRFYDKKRFKTNDSTITYEEWLELWIEQEGKCYWTDMAMTLDSGLPTDASLDRLDCSKPHTKENTVLVHKSLNLGRNDTNLNDWVQYLNACGLLAASHVADLKEAGILK